MSDPIYVDNTLLSSVATCTTKAVIRHIYGYTSKEESAALFAGTVAHEALALFFKGGTAKASRIHFKKRYKAWAEENVDESDKYQKRLSYRNVAKILRYWMDAHPMGSATFTVDPGAVEVGLQFPLTKNGDVIFYGRLDAGPVEMKQGRDLYILDHKTTGRIQNVEKYRMDSGPTGYVWGTQQHTSRPIMGAIINAIEFSQLPGLDDPTRKCVKPEHGKVPYEECQHLHVNTALVVTQRTPEQIKAWKRSALHLAGRFQVMKELYESPDELAKAPMEGTFTGACTYCEFKDFCRVGRPTNMLDSMLRHEPWKPYETQA